MIMLLFGGPAVWVWGRALVFGLHFTSEVWFRQRKDYYFLMESLSMSYRSYHVQECFGFVFHWCLLWPSISNISTWFLFHFSLRRWRRRNRALWRSVPECAGLVSQTGGWAFEPHFTLKAKTLSATAGGWVHWRLSSSCAPWTLPLLRLLRCPVPLCCTYL